MRAARAVPPFPARVADNPARNSAGLFEGRQYSHGSGSGALPCGRAFDKATRLVSQGPRTRPTPHGPLSAAVPDLPPPARSGISCPGCGRSRLSGGYHSPASRPAPRVSRSIAFVKTYVATPSNRQRDWVLVDASGKTLGRLATQIADMLRGKRKPEYTPHIDTGDFVVVVNAEKIARHRQQARGQALPPPFRLPGRAAHAHARGDARAPAGGGHPAGGEGHAAAQPARAPAAAQAEGLRGPRPSARGAAAASRRGWQRV